MEAKWVLKQILFFIFSQQLCFSFRIPSKRLGFVLYFEHWHVRVLIPLTSEYKVCLPSPLVVWILLGSPAATSKPSRQLPRQGAGRRWGLWAKQANRGSAVKPDQLCVYWEGNNWAQGCFWTQGGLARTASTAFLQVTNSSGNDTNQQAG